MKINRTSTHSPVVKNYSKRQPKPPEPSFKIDLRAFSTAEMFGLWLSTIFLSAMGGFWILTKTKREQNR